MNTFLSVLLILVTSTHQVFAIPFSLPDSNNTTSVSSVPYESSKALDYTENGNSNITEPMSKTYDRYVSGTPIHLIIYPSPHIYIPKKDVANTIVAVRAEVTGHKKKDPITDIITFPPTANLASFDYMPRSRAKRQITFGEMEKTASVIWNWYLDLEKSIFWVGMLVPVHIRVDHVQKGMIGDIWITDSQAKPGENRPVASASLAAFASTATAAAAADGNIPTS